MRGLYIFLAMILLNANAAEKLCPYSSNFILPTVKVSIEQLKNGDYKYSYIVTNKNESHLPLIWFFIETNQLVKEVKKPPMWQIMDWGKVKPEWTKWSTVDIYKGDIVPGKSVSGFELISKNPPGFVKFRIKGENYLPMMTSNVLEQDVLNLCPGAYQVGSSASGFDQIDGMTLGPIPTMRKSVDIRIRRIGKKSLWVGDLNTRKEDLLSFSPIEKGKVEVALIESSKLSVSDVDIPSIQFGSGKAKPIRAEISDCDISNKKSVKALLLTFNIEDINVLCNADHAIFLTAKTKTGDDIFGGVKIKVTECNQENWQREAQKMIDAGELELPKGKYKSKK